MLGWSCIAPRVTDKIPVGMSVHFRLEVRPQQHGAQYPWGYAVQGLFGLLREGG